MDTRSCACLLLLLSLPQGQRHQPLHRSKRRWVLTTLELQEEDPGPFPKLVGELFNNMSKNVSLMYLIRGPGVDEFPEIGLFSIEDHQSGKIYVHRPVDREVTPSFMVYFDAVDRSTGRVVDESLIFNIRIRDVNDHAPQFPEKEFNVSVKESQVAGQPIFQLLTVDLDQENTPNSQVLYFLVSQRPLLRESGFRIDLISGEVRLSGCLHYETAPLFTLIIRASDCGEPSLSSTATIHISVEDSNNHMPTFTEDHYEIQISEGQVEQSVLYLPVQDGDTPFTPAWRTQFIIRDGDEEGHFDIVTDPETNQGLLSIIKPLDFETQVAHSLIIIVENQEQLFVCKEGQLQPSRKPVASTIVVVQVLDTNDPPAFHPRSFIVSEEDGAWPAIQLGYFNATDPDRADSQIRYRLVHDPANWVAVDEKSGVVTTKSQIDRESPHVNDSFYTIVVHAVDNGLPPLTGTGTLLLFLSDVNDNAPTLQPHSRYLEVCVSAGSQALLLEAEDADLDPYAHPFTFDLDNAQGDVEETWMLRTKQGEGHSAELIMLRSLPPGDYLVPLFIADRQGLAQKQTVHVRICSCHSGSECEEHSDTWLLWWALSPVCAAFMALSVALLCLLRCSCIFGPKRLRDFIPSDSGHQTLIVYNEESKALSGQGCGMFFEPRRVKNLSSTPVSVDRMVPRRPLQLMEERVVEMWSQKLQSIDVLEGDTGYLPHVYREEGECEGAETLSSLTFLEQDLSPKLLGCSGSKSTPSEAMCCTSRVPS
ncbi:cadherin-like protein 26 isoform X1 [Mastomys coucha]|uniref:cadherin-like protein 26 isoform X1 n=1 Tax=Mastomys coucha TaxID=35658 RepID=UPI001262392A|nr:cadherin-like protein 26 isoform X1 [Mastomys coucha]